MSEELSSQTSFPSQKSTSGFSAVFYLLGQKAVLEYLKLCCVLFKLCLSKCPFADDPPGCHRPSPCVLQLHCEACHPSEVVLKDTDRLLLLNQVS